MTGTPLLDTSFPTLTLHRRGKVRDVCDLRDALLIVATDRISAPLSGILEPSTWSKGIALIRYRVNSAWLVATGALVGWASGAWG